MKTYEKEFDQHTWLKIKKKDDAWIIYLGCDGWFTPIGKPKYRRILILKLSKTIPFLLN